jgi:hypothetical protein
VEKNVSLQSVRLAKPVEEEQIANLPVMRVIFGSVSEDGEYLIRVRDSGEGLRYMLRYEVGDEVRFMETDFKGEEKLI